MTVKSSSMEFAVANSMGSIADNVLTALIRVNAGKGMEKDTQALKAGAELIEQMIAEDRGEIFIDYAAVYHISYRAAIQKCEEGNLRSEPGYVFSHLLEAKEALAAFREGRHVDEQLTLLAEFFDHISVITLTHARSRTRSSRCW